MGTNDEHTHGHPVRIPPLPTEEWTPEAVAAIGILPPEMAPPPGVMINSLGLLAHHPALAEAVLSFSLYLRFRSTLADRQRELLILRTAWLRGGEYELLRHARLARRYGFTDDELAAIATGSSSPVWQPDDAVLVRAAEELCNHYRIGDATWAELEARFTRQEVMDVLFVVGTYDMFAMAYNSMGLQPEADLPPFPVPLPGRG